MAQIFAVADYVSKITAKKLCKYGKYGSVEYFLLLLLLFALVYDNLKYVEVVLKNICRVFFKKSLA